LAALVVGAVLIQAVGIDPLAAYAALVKGAFGSVSGFGVTVQKTVPLLLTGLSVAVAFVSGIFSLGAEGQLYIGALFATVVAFLLPSLPAIIHVPLCLLAGFVGGTVWALIPGLLRVRYNINEIITTIMFNYIGLLIVSFVVSGPMKEAIDYSSQTDPIPASSELPIIWPEARMHLGIVLALVAALVVFLLMRRTTLGFEMRASGANISAARFAGIPTTRAMIAAMLISGGLAGLAGTCDVLGAQHRLSDFFSPGYGYDGIGVALLFTEHPLGVTASAFFFGALRAGLNAVQRNVGLPNALSQVLQGTVILFVVASRGIPRLARRQLGGRKRKRRSESE